ncbi:MAG: U32 family peptidase [Gammaproteobacteria bacterium]|nr:U32 family peptidase [Gammaproteobacteria bacterium]
MNYEYSLAPILYKVPDDDIVAFYNETKKIDALHSLSIGETVCTKRSRAKHKLLFNIAENMANAGKEVYISTPALIMDKNDIDYTTKIIKESEFPIEANDLTSISLCLEYGKAFSVGALVNTYNENTLQYFFNKGALKVSLPFEIPVESAVKIATSKNHKVEFTAYGKVPLSMSARCYHAKHYGKNKRTCAFVCEAHKTGMEISTIENQKILLVNGTMVMSPKTTYFLDKLELFNGSNIDSFKIIPDDLNSTLKLLKTLK